MRTTNKLMLLLGFTLSSLSNAEEAVAIGLRGGFSQKQVDNESFRQYEIFVNYTLPWNWNWSGGWRLDTRLEGTVGVLNGAEKTGLVSSIGPELSFSRKDLPLFLDLGVSPTVLSRSTFGNADLGGDLQFTSHIGIRFQISRKYRSRLSLSTHV